MVEEVCRLCLSRDNLSPIFVNVDQIERYSLVLALTTGLKIQPNDGLPQQICANCTYTVNKSLKLRNEAHLTERKLIKSGYKRSNPENKTSLKEENIEQTQNNDYLEDIATDCFDFDGFKIEIELDRITENGGVKEVNEAKALSVQPKKNSRKEKRELYLSLIEGDFDRNGPVKCKVCKKSVSKWACFINHAKKHLGFKFICEFCGKSFISSNQLKRHCRSYHGMERDLKCKHCNYLALDNAQLIIHERRVHTGERPYVCDVCAASYFSRKCLLQHIESHRHTTSVQCELCPASFKSRRHLAKHRYGAHSDKRRMRRRQQATDASIDRMQV
ncbi:zinc finger protein 22-like [Pectinophora gossypiella]|uniref:zinc finger protein 22-like n=1 Tax=Pectinophora gossypiella TaxID=13191 RepID=UPI00214E1363|nr:zinc finger protein 22-like [Pectinophora gossypiella]